MTYKEKRLERKLRHENFRAFYWKDQMNRINIISLVIIIFSVIALFYIVPFENPIYPYLGRLKYGISLVGSILVAGFTKWFLITKRLTDEKKAVASEIFTFILGLLYLIWGIIGLEITIIEEHTPVVLMYLILMAVLTAFMYFPLSHYIWLVTISYILAGVVFVKHDDHPLGTTSSICAVVMMLVLGVLANTRYVFGRDRFEFEGKNNKLLEERESQNEMLEAQNEELVAVNTELNDTTDKLSTALENLEQATEAQKMFTNSMNHELRAPLNGIIGTIQIMLMENQTAENIENLNQCMNLSKSLLGIVNDLLDYAKIDAGEFEIFPANFDLGEVMYNIESMFKNQADIKGIDLRFDIDDDMVCGLYGDDFRLQQIIANIVSNAVKYTEKGSIDVKCSFENDLLKFVISDTGQGMSQESLKHLFTPFKRIEEAKNKKIQGTGLGMAIVMFLVNKMGGSIDVDSKLGEGTRFTVLIPSKITDASITWGNRQNRKKVKDSTNTINLQGKKFLYVDDTKMNLKIMEKLMSDTGVVITSSSDPFEGLELAKKYQYDIIILDHEMPDITGPELFAEMRRTSDYNKETPTIIFTGNATTGSEDRYKKMGFAGYIFKPVLKDKLLSVISKLI